MQYTTDVALVATHLAATDRRALSQAWYSALHLAERTPRQRAHAAATARDRRPGAATPHGVPARPQPPARGTARALTAVTDAARRNASASAPERRAIASPLTRRLEHALARRVPRGVPASFVVRIAEGRVHVLVRGDGARLRIIALCPTALRERVERALAHARFTLAARGERALACRVQTQAA